MKDYTLEDIQELLIAYLAKFSVRKDMCLPILLMLGKHEKEMLELMVYMRDNNPTEHEIIQKAIELDPNPQTPLSKDKDLIEERPANGEGEGYSPRNPNSSIKSDGKDKQLFIYLSL